MLVALTLSLAVVIDWNQEAFHVIKSAASYFVNSDIHLYTGHINTTGGAVSTVTGHCKNGTVADYVVRLTANPEHPGSTQHTFTLNTTLGADQLGGQLFCDPDRAYFAYTKAGQQVGVLTLGLNPGAPTCATSHSQDACEVPGTCDWCTSLDGVHSLCCESSNLPPSTGWNCQPAK